MKWKDYKIQKDIYRNLCKNNIEMDKLSKKEKQELYLANICNHYQGKRFYTNGPSLIDKKSSLNIPINQIYGKNQILAQHRIAYLLQKECNYSYCMLIRQNISPQLKDHLKKHIL